ncbi:hypothetical protein DPMN_085742 [Dreissena polymorpha]|uniref:Uncharacterized protein n=1 Tax=Dreissena polymorpha TaxID=45954 RepID=A0A9D3YD86_DREPO|nr:hypothetical protein DPMN_085742 [Dreissena polymorpha]
MPLKFNAKELICSVTNVLTKFHAEINSPALEAIIKTNILNECYEDWTINVTFRAKNAPPLVAILVQDIIGTNLLTKFHYNQTVNVASRVLTRKMLAENAPPHCGHVFQTTKTKPYNLKAKCSAPWTQLFETWVNFNPGINVG